MEPNLNPIRLPIPIGRSTRLSRLMHAKNLFFIYAIASIFFCIMSALFFSNSIRFDRSSPPSTVRTNRPFPTPAAMAAQKKGIPETFYISHGSPTLSIDDSLPARPFLKSFQQKILPEKPKAILIISGHWETAEPAVNAVSGPSDTIYDFYGFPDKMYKLKYPAPGSPQLANRVKELLQGAGFETVHVDRKRGLDHGAWVPLMLMYPEADIPVCQLSVQTEKDGAHHYRMGEALRPLKDDGVLIVGSGAATHNLRKINRDGRNKVESWAQEFDNWIKEALEEGRYEDVNRYEEKAPNAKMAHPWPDHFYPLHVAMGAAGDNTKGELIHHSWTHGTLSYASYKFVEKK